VGAKKLETTLRQPETRFRFLSSLFSAILSLTLILYLVLSEYSVVNRKYPPNWQSRNFFSAQLESILHGQLNVSPSDLPSECYIYRGLCYGYYGITPSIFRIPLIYLFGYRGFSDMMVILAVAFGILGSILLVNQVWRMFEAREPHVDSDQLRFSRRTLYVAVVVAAGPGNILFQLSVPTVYWEAIAWGSGLSVFGVLFLLRWIEKRSIKSIVVAGFFFILSANARPTGAVTALVCGIVLMIYSHLYLRGAVHRFTNAAFLAMAGLPMLSMVSIFWLKVHMLIPSLSLNEEIPKTPWWAAIWKANGGKGTGLEFIPSNLVSYLRPDSLGFRNGFHLSILRSGILPFDYIPPLHTGGMYTEATASISALAPFACILLLIVLVKPKLIDGWQLVENSYENPRQIPAWMIRGLTLGALAGVGITLAFCSNSNRYLGDFAPGMIVGLALGSIVVLRAIERCANIARITILTLLGISILGAVTNTFLAYTYIHGWGG
jgi:hypothetical protein